jgi:hypothetical protein
MLRFLLELCSVRTSRPRCRDLKIPHPSCSHRFSAVLPTVENTIFAIRYNYVDMGFSCIDTFPHFKGWATDDNIDTSTRPLSMSPVRTLLTFQVRGGVAKGRSVGNEMSWYAHTSPWSRTADIEQQGSSRLCSP